MSTVVSQSQFRRRVAGFSLVELLVTLLVSSILLVATVSTYDLFRKSIGLDQNRATISQNGRVAADRLAREIRQTPDVVTEFPADASDTSTSQPGEIEFEDGHAEDLSYHHYYISGTILKMDLVEYYFSYATSTRVHWDSVGTGGVDPVRHVISTQDIADLVKSISFYGSKPVQMVLVTGSGNQTYTLRTEMYERNI